QSPVVDRLAILIGFAAPLMVWIRTGRRWQRVADIELPNGILFSAMLSRWVSLRRTDRILAEFGVRVDELGTFLGTRMRQSDERSQQLLKLQTSLERYATAEDARNHDLLRLSGNVERLTRWLVRLTIVLGVIGVAGVGVAVWTALK